MHRLESTKGRRSVQSSHMMRRLERRCISSMAPMQQQQHSHVAKVAIATKSQSHHCRDRSLLLVPAKSDPPKPELGGMAADGATAGAEVVLPLPPAGRPSMEADAFPPDLPGRLLGEEDWEFGGKACSGAKAGSAVPGKAAFPPVTGLPSADEPSMDATPFLLSLLPRMPGEADGKSAAAGEAAEEGGRDVWRRACDGSILPRVGPLACTITAAVDVGSKSADPAQAQKRRFSHLL